MSARHRMKVTDPFFRRARHTACCIGQCPSEPKCRAGPPRGRACLVGESAHSEENARASSTLHRNLYTRRTSNPPELRQHCAPHECRSHTPASVVGSGVSPAPGIPAGHAPRDGRTHELLSATKSAERDHDVSRTVARQLIVRTTCTRLWPDKHAMSARWAPEGSSLPTKILEARLPWSCRQHNPSP